MKSILHPLRFSLFAGMAAGLALQPLQPLHASNQVGITLRGHDAGDDKGSTGGGHDVGDDKGGGHDIGDDHGGTIGSGGDDHGGGGQHHDDHGQTEFLGTIQALPSTADLTGIWTVDGRAVTVDASTLIRTDKHGAPVVGGRVEVEGVVQPDGSVLASVIKTEDQGREFEDNVFFGTVQALPDAGIIGTWRISGLTVVVNDATRVETEAAAPAVGSLVRVEGVQQADASFVATELKVLAVAPGASTPEVVKLKGIIERLPGEHGKGNWIIDGTVVTVTDDSIRVKGGRKAKVGRKVTIKGDRQINGSILAGKVKVPKAKRP